MTVNKILGNPMMNGGVGVDVDIDRDIDIDIIIIMFVLLVGGYI